VTNHFHSPAVYNSVTDSSTASHDSSQCEGLIRSLSTYGLTLLI